MKNLSYFFVFLFLASCTSNTIFKEPEDLIPRDTMTLLLGDMMIASSAKFIQNKNEQKKVNYMAFIYDKYKIDSLRFQNSNLYYTSKIDLYEEMITDVKKNLEDKKDFYNKISSRKDSIRRDSIKKVGKKLKKIDSIRKEEKILDPNLEEFQIKI